MGTRKLLYRYRSSEEYNIAAFLSDSINGSLFATFPDVGELNFGIPSGRFSKYGATKEDERKMVDSLINNSNNHYYMACLSYNNPYSNKKMWLKYAKGGGFCLAFDYQSIKDAVDDTISNGAFAMVSNVNYSDEMYDLSPFYDPFLKTVYDNKDEPIEKLECLLDKTKASLYTTEYGKYVVNSFVHKKKEYSNEREVRIILQKIPKGNQRNPTHINQIIKIKPIKVIVSKNMNAIDQYRIFMHARENNISFETIN